VLEERTLKRLAHAPAPDNHAALLRRGEEFIAGKFA